MRAGFSKAFLTLALLAFQPFAVDARMRTDRLWIVTQAAEHPVDIEIAETEEEKALGLMFRNDLPPGTGMLFPYDMPRVLTMWMKNTYVPLDMVFIRKDGVIHRIHRNAEPQSEAIISSEGEVAAVLEIKAGEADRLGVKSGDRVRHPLFVPSKSSYGFEQDVALLAER